MLQHNQRCDPLLSKEFSPTQMEQRLSVLMFF
jgi:hypothetical protein